MSDCKEKIVLRPAVQRFAEQMERNLCKHDEDRGVDGWLGHNFFNLLDRVRDETKELHEALRHVRDVEKAIEILDLDVMPDKTRTKRAGAVADAIKEAADVANFAMMIADNLSAMNMYGKKDPDGNT